MKFAFDLYLGRPDYKNFVICHSRNRYRDEDFVIRHGGNILDEDFVIHLQVVNRDVSDILSSISNVCDKLYPIGP